MFVLGHALAASALRFYEERGLLQSVRDSGGHRRYLRSVLRRVALIVFAQRVGLTLHDVRQELAKLPENRVPESADWLGSRAAGRTATTTGSRSSND